MTQRRQLRVVSVVSITFALVLIIYHVVTICLSLKSHGIQNGTSLNPNRLV